MPRSRISNAGVPGGGPVSLRLAPAQRPEPEEGEGTQIAGQDCLGCRDQQESRG